MLKVIQVLSVFFLTLYSVQLYIAATFGSDSGLPNKKLRNIGILEINCKKADNSG